MAEEGAAPTPKPEPVTSSQHDIGASVPEVPFLDVRGRVDRGVAGSLIQTRDRELAQRRAERPAVVRDWRAWAAVVLAVVAVVCGVLTARAVLAVDPAALLLVWPVLLALPAGLWCVAARYDRGDVVRDLSVAIDRERRAARALDTLRGHGWTVMHDRLLVGTEHRVGHVLVGPAGVVIANVLPVEAPLRLEGGVLLTGETPLVDWFSSRWWEANTMNAALMQRLSAWPWTGPVYPVAMYPGAVTSRWSQVLQPPQTKKTPAAPTHPAVYARMTVREPERVRAWVTSLPSPLGRLAAAQLAAEVEAACPPAAMKD
ncbi:hypothetical protein GCM10009756_31000 [Pseudokineococcus marinus]